jgi:hypothetical protein
MGGAALASGAFGLGFGGVFGERGRLPLAGAFPLVEAFFQLGDALFEFSILALVGAASRAWPVVVHAGKIEKRRRCSCAETYLPTNFRRGDR